MLWQHRLIWTDKFRVWLTRYDFSMGWDAFWLNKEAFILHLGPFVLTVDWWNPA